MAKTVTIPSFYKSKQKNNFHALGDGFSALEGEGTRVTEVRLNEIDLDILKRDPDFIANSIIEGDSIQVWGAEVVVDDRMEDIKLTAGDEQDKL
jgi:hypothetical protein